MGVADSPLAGRVVFVVGAPRSGTTWLTALLATHPQIAGTGSESHLFDRGVGTLFDNHERTAQAWLSAYVSSEELTDLARELCDGVLLRIRERTKPDAAFVVEKTPVYAKPGRQAIERKVRCFPDAWYLHIVRDAQATVRSLMRAPFLSHRSEVGYWRGVRDGVDAIREATAGHPRYLEVRYEDLQADTGASMAAILDRLGLDAGEEVRERVRRLSAERFARRASPPPSTARQGRLKPLVGKGRRLASSLRRSRSAVPSEPQSANFVLANQFVSAARKGDADAVRDLTAPNFSIEVRAANGDVVAKGDDARREFLDFGRRVLQRPFVTVDWRPADGRPYATFLFHGIAPNASRVNFSLHVFPAGERVAGLTVVSTGQLEGPPSSFGGGRSAPNRRSAMSGWPT